MAEYSTRVPADTFQPLTAHVAPGISPVSPDTPVRLFMSSDVRAATGLSRTHLDFYIREALVRPIARTESGYLLFDQQEVALLRRIVQSRQQGIGLREIREQIGR